jgi:hypothetical protein
MPPLTASPTMIGMLGAGLTAPANPTLAASSSWPTTDSEGRQVDPDARAGPDQPGVVVEQLSSHANDTASAPLGLSASGSNHNPSAAAGASGSVTGGGASASVLGLLESIFGLGDGRSGDLGPLANVQDYAWRLARQPGFAPD